MEMAKKSQLYRNYGQNYGQLLRQTEKVNFKNSRQKRNTGNYVSERIFYNQTKNNLMKEFL